jgi:hypothetical protein
LRGSCVGERSYWAKPGASAEQFREDNFACARIALGYVETSEMRAGLSRGIGAFGAQSFKGQKVNEEVFNCRPSREPRSP